MFVLQAQTPEFKAYQQQVMRNCAVFAEELIKRGFSLISGETKTT